MNAQRSAIDEEELRWGAGFGALGLDLGYACAVDALLDPRGWTVRCTPWRRTVRITAADFGSGVVYAKHRRAEPRWFGESMASREWSALAALSELGLRTAEPVFVARHGAHSVIGTLAAVGRSFDVCWADTRRDPERRAQLVDYARRTIMSDVAKLHAAGWCYRDLYWNHVFVEVAHDGPCGAPTWIDVERAFVPRWRRRRWIVKDLAGLAASWPGDGLDCAHLRAILSEHPGFDAATQRAVMAKAARILAHRPRYG